ncbi:alpha/beta hydrolase [Nonomuraea longispora]|nr:alpha/beta hydrolase [Nonomuraea longispora]
MRLPSRPLPAVLTGTLTLVASLVVATPVVAQAQAGAIDWQSCTEPKEGMQCATIKVPLDWSRPKGRTIQIGLARRKATGPASTRIGTALMVPGGPGTSGVAVLARDPQFTAAVQERFDVVTFDPRGINTSTQIKCATALVDKVMNTPMPQSNAAFESLKLANKQLSENCRKLSGPLYDHMDNLHVVQDMDAIRAALGENKITQIGYSYGTVRVQQYAAMFPDRVRASVADGNVDHSIETITEMMDSATAPAEKNFLQFAAWCDKTADCALYGRGTKKIFGELRERAKKGTLKDPLNGQPLDVYGLSRIALGVNMPELWKDVASTFKSLYDGGAAMPKPKAAPKAKAGKTQNFTRQASFCQDWNFRIKQYSELRTLLSRLAAKYPNMMWNDVHRAAVLDCAGYPGKATNPQAPLKIVGAPPMVMVGNVNEYASVYAWSKNAAKQAGATLVTYEGYGHTVYPRTVAYGPSDCVNDLIDDYLINLRVPARGSSCAGIEVPGTGGPQPPRS